MSILLKERPRVRYGGHHGQSAKMLVYIVLDGVGVGGLNKATLELLGSREFPK